MKLITPQERRVLEMIANGKSTKEVALVLGISNHTVESHRKNLLLKLNVKNSAELVKKAIESKVLILKPTDHSETELNPNRYEGNE